MHNKEEINGKTINVKVCITVPSTRDERDKQEVEKERRKDIKDERDRQRMMIEGEALFRWRGRRGRRGRKRCYHSAQGT